MPRVSLSLELLKTLSEKREEGRKKGNLGVGWGSRVALGVGSQGARLRREWDQVATYLATGKDRKARREGGLWRKAR